MFTRKKFIYSNRDNKDGRDRGRNRDKDRDRDRDRDRDKKIRKSPKFQISADEKIEYKNLSFLQKFVSERGKILSRRITGVSAKGQRKIVSAIKVARFLGLLDVGGIRK